MYIFVTGATGFIGSALVPELLKAGHTVLGMTRSEKGAETLAKAGADVHHGSLEDIESLKAGAAQADAVIHLAFNNDFSRFQASCEEDRGAIAAMGEVLAGSGRPFIGTSGVLTRNPIPGQLYDEDDPKPDDGFPRLSENATLEAAEKGVRAIVMRLSRSTIRRSKGWCAFDQDCVGKEGVGLCRGRQHRWAAAHVSDTARLYRLALEKGEAGSKWHAVGEQGVTAKEIAEALGRRLNLPVVSISPEEAPAHFGSISHFVTLDSPTSNAKTRERLGWEPTGPGLIDDLNHLVL